MTIVRRLRVNCESSWHTQTSIICTFWSLLPKAMCLTICNSQNIDIYYVFNKFTSRIYNGAPRHFLTETNGLGHMGDSRGVLLPSAGVVLLTKINDFSILQKLIEALTTWKTCKTQVVSQSMHCETSVFCVCFDHAHGFRGKGKFSCSFWSTPIDGIFFWLWDPWEKLWDNSRSQTRSRDNS